MVIWYLEYNLVHNPLGNLHLLEFLKWMLTQWLNHRVTSKWGLWDVITTVIWYLLEDKKVKIDSRERCNPGSPSLHRTGLVAKQMCRLCSSIQEVNIQHCTRNTNKVTNKLAWHSFQNRTYCFFAFDSVIHVLQNLLNI